MSWHPRYPNTKACPSCSRPLLFWKEIAAGLCEFCWHWRYRGGKP